MEASHEPQRAAGILPAEEAWFYRRDVGSTLLGRASRFTMVRGSDARPILEFEAAFERSPVFESTGFRAGSALHGAPDFA